MRTIYDWGNSCVLSMVEDNPYKIVLDAWQFVLAEFRQTSGKENNII